MGLKLKEQDVKDGNVIVVESTLVQYSYSTATTVHSRPSRMRRPSIVSD